MSSGSTCRRMTSTFMRAAVLASLVLTAVAQAGIVTFVEDTSNFTNPERGFAPSYEAPWPDQVTWDFCGSGNNFTAYNWTAWTPALNGDELRNYRSQGMTVVMMRYHIAEFRDSPISQAFLDRLEADCATARAQGFKINMRFAYNYPWGGPDAPLERVLEHIGELKQTFHDNVDVIAFVDLGFIGCWGEMHTSSNVLVENGIRQINDATRAIIDSLLASVPVTRMIAVRYPVFKFEYFGNTDHSPSEPLSSDDAFNGSVKARWGHHDDCPVCGEWNAGTYWSFRENAEEIIQYLEAENLYLVQSGEPGDPGTGSSTTDDDGDGYVLGEHESCERILDLFGRVRWSVLNATYNLGSPASYDRWKSEECFSTICKKLGYRYRLISADIPDTLFQDKPSNVAITVVNDGWAGIYNPRDLELVLEAVEGGTVHRVPVRGREIRKVLPLPAQTSVITFTDTIPDDVPQGRYELYVNLPDPEVRLNDDARYSIRLANDGVWDSTTGYNSLGADIWVAAGTAGVVVSDKRPSHCRARTSSPSSICDIRGRIIRTDLVRRPGIVVVREYASGRQSTKLIINPAATWSAR